MWCRVPDGIRSLAATSLVVGTFSAGGVSASVEVRGSIDGPGFGSPVDIALVRAPSLYELLTAVLNDDSVGLYRVEATVQARNGRFSMRVGDPEVRWVTARRNEAAARAYLLVGPETDTLLPTLEFGKDAICTLTLTEPRSAWIASGQVLRGAVVAPSWRAWPPLRRLEAGAAGRFVLETGATLSVGAPGHEPATVECASGTASVVRLEPVAAPIVEGLLRRDGLPLPEAILVDENGWPVARTDALGRYRAPPGVYEVLYSDGGVDGFEASGGVAELAATAPMPVSVGMTAVEGVRSPMPLLVTHWSSSGALLARNHSRPDEGWLSVEARPGAARTTLSAERFSQLRITWPAQPTDLSLERLHRLTGLALDLAGDPVEGAEVSTALQGAGPFGVTDGAGRFVVEVGEPLDRGWLVARAPGFRATRTKLDDVLAEFGSEQIVVEMEPARAIVGRLVSASTGDGVSGTVLLAHAGAIPRFVGDSALWRLEDPSVLRAVSTNGDGSFRLDPVDETHVRLLATSPGHGTLSMKLPDYRVDGAGDQRLGEVILQLEIVVRGRVTDEDGSAVEGAAVDFGRDSPPGLFAIPLSASSTAIEELRTDSDGNFRIGGLARGDDLSLEVSAPGFVKASVSVRSVDVSMGGEEVEVRLRRAGELTGRITDEVTGAGIEGARLFLAQTVRGGGAWGTTDDGGAFLLGGFPPGAGILTVRADGYQALEHLLAEAPRAPLELALRPEPDIDVVGVVVREGAPVGGASVSIGSTVSVTDSSGRFHLRSAAGRARLACRVPGAVRPNLRELDVASNMGEITIDVTPVTVRGQVTGSGGRPAGSASVRAWPAGTLALRGPERVATGPGGDFELRVEPGSYRLSAHRGNAHGPEVEVAVVAGDEPHVDLTVPDPDLVRVRVVGLTAAEAAEVVVSIQALYERGGMAGRALVRATGGTDAEPVFETAFQRPESAMVVAAASVAGRTRRAPVEYASAGVTEVVISFADGEGVVEGSVMLDGWPLPGEHVHVADRKRGMTWDVRTDHAGTFVIDGLRPGDEISLAALGQERSVRVTNATARVHLETRSASVRGLLFDAGTGLPAAGASVSAVPAQFADSGEVVWPPRRRWSTRTAEDGSFVLDGLFSVPYRLEVRPSGSNRMSEDSAGSADVDLSAGDAEVILPVRVPPDQ